MNEKLSDSERTELDAAIKTLREDPKNSAYMEKATNLVVHHIFKGTEMNDYLEEFHRILGKSAQPTAEQIREAFSESHAITADYMIETLKYSLDAAEFDDNSGLITDTLDVLQEHGVDVEKRRADFFAAVKEYQTSAAAGKQMLWIQETGIADALGNMTNAKSANIFISASLAAHKLLATYKAAGFDVSLQVEMYKEIMDKESAKNPQEQKPVIYIKYHDLRQFASYLRAARRADDAQFNEYHSKINSLLKRVSNEGVNINRLHNEYKKVCDEREARSAK